MPSLTPTPARPRPHSPRGGLGDQRSWLLLVILTAQLMVVLDGTIVNVALPHIQRGLGFSSGALSWVLNAYILTFGGLLLLGARAGDIIGRRRVFLSGIALFSASSLLGGLAGAGWMLLSARALQGVGAALAAPAALSLLTAVFPEGPERVRALALYTTVSAAGGATGLVAGALLTEFASWRFVMFVNVPIGLAVLSLGARVLTETPRRHGRFDVLGALTSTAAVTGAVLGLVNAGSSGWTSPVTLLPLLGGAGLAALFVRIERRAAEPVLPLRLVAHATRSAANASRGLLYAGMYATFFFLSQFLQDVQRLSPLSAGVAFLPLPLSVFASSQLTSRVLVRRLPERTVMLLGAAVATVGLVLATQIDATTPYGQVLASLVLMGAGMGSSFVSLTSASLQDVSPADAGAASGLINVTQQLGAALGLAVLVSVFGGVTAHAQLGPQSATSERLVATAIHGFDTVFWLAVAFALGALALVARWVRTPPDPTVVVLEIDQMDRAA